jgi:hypothetical protein
VPTRGKNNINSGYNELFLNWSPGQVKPKTIILVFVASQKITVLRIKTKSKDGLAQNQ